jgi:antitoxin VapB
VAINIRNSETERLARLVAQEADETMTDAIMIALRERLTKLRASRTVNERIEAILKVARQCQVLPDLNAPGGRR